MESSNEGAKQRKVCLHHYVLCFLKIYSRLGRPIDQVTECWPMPQEYQTSLEDIKPTHKAVPLWVFANGKPVIIHDLQKVLPGTVVKMQFELHHFPIQQKNVDSFNAYIQQIQVIRPGKNRPQTAFKRQSMSEGPIEVAESVTVLHVDPVPADKKKRMEEIGKDVHIKEDKGMIPINQSDGY